MGEKLLAGSAVPPQKNCGRRVSSTKGLLFGISQRFTVSNYVFKCVTGLQMAYQFLSLGKFLIQCHDLGNVMYDSDASVDLPIHVNGRHIDNYLFLQRADFKTDIVDALARPENFHMHTFSLSNIDSDMLIDYRLLWESRNPRVCWIYDDIYASLVRVSISVMSLKTATAPIICPSLLRTGIRLVIIKDFPICCCWFNSGFPS